MRSTESSTPENGNKVRTATGDSIGNERVTSAKDLFPAGKILSQQAVGVLIAATLPRTAWIAEIDLHVFPGEIAVSDRLTIGGNTFLVAAIAILVGVQIVGFGVIARHFAATNGFLPPSRGLTAVLPMVSLDRGLLIALGVVLDGLAGMGWSLSQWAAVDFGPITNPVIMRVSTLSLILIAIGVQTAFTCFLLGIIDVPLRRTAILLSCASIASSSGGNAAALRATPPRSARPCAD